MNETNNASLYILVYQVTPPHVRRNHAWPYSLVTQYCCSMICNYGYFFITSFRPTNDLQQRYTVLQRAHEQNENVVSHPDNFSKISMIPSPYLARSPYLITDLMSSSYYHFLCTGDNLGQASYCCLLHKSSWIIFDESSWRNDKWNLKRPRSTL